MRMIMEEHERFPAFWGAVLILVLLIAVQLLISITLFELGFLLEAGEPRAVVMTVALSSGIVFPLLMKYKRLTYAEMFAPVPNSLNSVILLLAIPVLFTVSGAVVWISDIAKLIVLAVPVTEREWLMFSRLMGSGLASAILVCFVAPFVEEMLFRGIILRGFLGNYSVKTSITLSSLLFALYHLNLYQLPAAFLLGLFFGWLYVRSGSLWTSILAHSLYNGCAMLLWTGGEVLAESDMQSFVQFNPAWMNGVALILSIIGLFMLQRLLSKAPRARP